MKVLWSVNVVLPDVAQNIGLKRGHAISWVDAMRTAIAESDENIELAIVCNGGLRVGKFMRYEQDHVKYYILPRDCNFRDYWNLIIGEFSPDIIHIYGTEKHHNIGLIKQFGKKIPIMISLQGIISEYVKHYYAFIPLKDIVANYTLRDLLLHNGILEKKRAFSRQSKYERWMFSSVKYVEGRSEWDRAISLNINPSLNYFYCPRMIRKPFFEHRWEENGYTPHSIFVHQGDYPIKGLHFMIDALSIIKKKYPDAKLYVSGANIFETKRLKERGYTRYIRKKISELDMIDSVVFTGYLKADALAEILKHMHICVIPSAIENAPNALAEAMIVGTPCVASNVGGVAEMLDYGRLGLLYNYFEPQMLAERISQLFDDPELAATFSKEEMETARSKHSQVELLQRLKAIYFKVLELDREA